jgi:hypothetical protein
MISVNTNNGFNIAGIVALGLANYVKVPMGRYIRGTPSLPRL